ncbi:hypothetical protein GLAREA_11096 [Glarea lozoyensis ATCC 20868]|uniref:Uncharacterized protein n=1 Tax=Glarea lozoyensis (strain ATCC 20868 / MF5171) TaxID=1116229 RepID=S3DAC1_GLAL2|nr:uncharacterized protein GLAREA_11096 [Glarea lozoyensis ATCC 20868]EPE35397.1 hypothetical protein GLAREA_11096 [Glarea lozoyensis ATCC 20868]
MTSHVVTEEKPLPLAFFQQIANASALDEISNSTGSVRFHIFWHGNRNRDTNKLLTSLMFFVYQTTRHGPQNGFRLCLVHPGFHIPSPDKIYGDPEDDIDRLEKTIPQGHMEIFVLGDAPIHTSDEEIGFTG